MISELVGGESTAQRGSHGSACRLDERTHMRDRDRPPADKHVIELDDAVVRVAKVIDAGSHQDTSIQRRDPARGGGGEPRTVGLRVQGRREHQVRQTYTSDADRHKRGPGRRHAAAVCARGSTTRVVDALTTAAGRRVS
jgi:hypothetical protein